MTATPARPPSSSTIAPVSARPVGRRSKLAFELFRWYVRRYVRRRFHALRLAKSGYRPGAGAMSPAGPVVVVLNHPSWWDPMIGLVLSDFWPSRVHLAPIEASALERYKFFERLGFFGVEAGSARGARAFLRQGLSLLDDPEAMMWVTAQGRFVDARVRPTTLKPGVGHLAARLGRGCILPLALEYSFWNESTPEAFARFAPPLTLGGPDRLSGGEWTERVARVLEETQDALAADVLARDPARFDTVLAGGAGVGGVYDAWRRLKANLRGRRFVAAHGDDA